jgi:transposase
MSRRSIIKKEHIEKAIEIVKQAEDLREMREALSVLLPELTGMNLTFVGKLIGKSRATVARYRRDFLLHLTEVGEKCWGGRRRFYLSLEEENRLLHTLHDKAQKAGFLVVNEIKKAFEFEVGHEIAESTIYRLLSRHGWRKIAPRRRHPKSNHEDHDEFKKNSKQKWLWRRKVATR